MSDTNGLNVELARECEREIDSTAALFATQQAAEDERKTKLGTKGDRP